MPDGCRVGLRLRCCQRVNARAMVDGSLDRVSSIKRPDMDHKTAVLVIVNAMQSDKSPEGIQREIDELLQTVAPEEREAVLREARETYRKVEARLPVDPSASGG
jgi:hypothetical protein